MAKFLWDDVLESKDYKDADIITRRRIKESYFDKVIAPAAPFDSQRLSGLRDTFLAEEDNIPLPPTSYESAEQVRKTRDLSPFLAGPLAQAAKVVPPGTTARDLGEATATAGLGAAHTVASGLKPATFGASEKVGLGKEGVADVLRGRGVSEEALTASQVVGELAGYGVVLPALLQVGGAQALGAGAQRALLAKGASAGTSKFLANTLKWALAGFEHGALSERVNVEYDKIVGENPSLGEELGRVGVAGGKEAALFATMEMALVGLAKGGRAFLGTRTGRKLVAAAKRLWENPPPDIDVSKLYQAYSNVPGLEIKLKPEEVPGFAQTAEYKLSQRQAIIDAEIKAKRPSIIPSSSPRNPDAQIIIPNEVKERPDILIDTVNRFVRTPQRHAALRKRVSSLSEQTPKITERPVTAETPAQPTTPVKTGPSVSLKAQPRGPLKTETRLEQPREPVAQPARQEAVVAEPTGFKRVSLAKVYGLEKKPKFDVEAILVRGKVAKEEARVSVGLPFKNSKEAVDYGVKIADNLKAKRDLVIQMMEIEKSIEKFKSLESTRPLSTKERQDYYTVLNNKSITNEAFDVATSPNPGATRASFLLEKTPTPKLAQEVLTNPDFQTRASIEKASKIMSETPTPQPIQESKSWASRLREASESYGQQNSVIYKSGNRTIHNAMSTEELNLVKEALLKGEIPTDLSGHRITEWLSDTPLGEPNKGLLGLGEEGFIYTKALTDLGVTIKSRAAEAIKWFETNIDLIKNWVPPYSLARKYPKFKAIFDAFNSESHARNEAFVIGWDLMEQATWKQLLNDARKANISKALQFGNSPVGRPYLDSSERAISLGGNLPNYYSAKELRELHRLNPEEVKVAQNFIKTQEYGTGKRKELHKEKLGYFDLASEVEQLKSLPALNEVQQKQLQESITEMEHIQQTVDKSFARLKGYFHNRRSGEWVVNVHDSDGKRIWSDRFKSKKLAKESAATLSKKLNVPDSSIEVNNYKHLSRKSIRRFDLDNLIDLAAESKRGMSEETKVAIDEALVQMKNTIRRQRLDHYSIQRNDIPGFDTGFDNLADSIFEYIDTTVNQLAMIRSHRKALAALHKIDPNISPSLYSIGRQYIDNYFAEGANSYTLLQKIIYHNGLGLGLGSAVSNSTQGFTMTIPEIAKYYSSGVDAEAAFSRAISNSFDYAKHVIFKKPFNGDKELLIHLNTLSRRGLLGGRQYYHIVGEQELKKPTAKAAVKVGRTYMEIAGAPMRYTEEMNRTIAAVASFDIARNLQGLRGRAILDFMTSFIDATQVPYGRHNIPNIVTGAGNFKRVARSIYTYGSFMQHYLSWLTHAHEEGTAKAMRAYLNLAGLTGITGIPLANQLLQAVGIDVPQKIRDVGEDFGIPKQVTDVVLKGFPTLVGVDLSRTVGFDSVLPRSFGITDIARAPGRMLNNLKQSVELVMLGENWKALSKLPITPRGLADVFRAIQIAKNGVTNFKGERITGGGPERFSAKDIALTAMGVPSLKLSDVYDVETFRKEIEKKHHEKVAEVNTKLAKALADGDTNRYMSELKKLQKKNARLPLEERIYPSADSIKEQMLKQRGITSTSTKASRQLRLRIKQIQEQHGVTV